MRLPLARFYWTVLEAPGVRAGTLPPGLWRLLEEDLPVNADEVWAVGVPIDEQRLLVCALPRSELAESAGELELTPDGVPDWVSASVDSSRLNLLIDEYEPAPIRATRTRRRLMHASLTLVAALLCVVGLERRGSRWREDSRSLQSSVQTIVAAELPGGSADDLAMALSEQKMVAPPRVRVPEDAAVVLAGVLDAWPFQTASRVQSISASGESASVSLIIPQSGDAAAFIAALHPPGGWKLEEPRLVSVNEGARINLELRKAAP